MACLLRHFTDVVAQIFFRSFWTFLRKLQVINVEPKLLYLSIIDPLITYCSMCYYPALSVSNHTKLLKISHVAAKFIGLPSPMLSEVIDCAILKKAVVAECDHPLFIYFHVHLSRSRYRCIKMQNGSLQHECCGCGDKNTK